MGITSVIRPVYYFHTSASPIIDVPESQSQPTQPVADQEPETEARRNAADARADGVLLSRVQRARGCRHSGTDERARGDVLKEQGDGNCQLLAVSRPRPLFAQIRKIDNVQVPFVSVPRRFVSVRNGREQVKKFTDYSI